MGPPGMHRGPDSDDDRRASGGVPPDPEPRPRTRILGRLRGVGRRRRTLLLVRGLFCRRGVLGRDPVGKVSGPRRRCSRTIRLPDPANTDWHILRSRSIGRAGAHRLPTPVGNRLIRRLGRLLASLAHAALPPALRSADWILLRGGSRHESAPVPDIHVDGRRRLDRSQPCGRSRALFYLPQLAIALFVGSVTSFLVWLSQRFRRRSPFQAVPA